MAGEQRSTESGLPLDSFTKSVPPGWKPNQPRYPYRRYRQLLGLWWAQTDATETSAGPIIAGRLQGTAFQFAMSLSQTRVDMTDPMQGITRLMTGDELLSQASAPRPEP